LSLWLGSGCNNKAKIEGSFAVCTCDHLTSFGVGDYIPEPEPVVEPEPEPPGPPVEPEEEEDERDYNFWGCFNAFHIACIHLFFYLLLIPIVRRKDKLVYDIYSDPRIFGDLIDSPDTAEV
jgi:hypothetical protein